MKRKLILIIIAWMLVFTSSWTTTSADQIQIITDLGNVFSVEKENTVSTATTTSIVGGTGATVRVIEPQGKVIHGKGISGLESSLVPYVDVSKTTDFASVVKKDDKEISMRVPEFAKDYQYADGQLQQIKQQIPNILSYSTTKTHLGSASASVDDNGIKLTGPEKSSHIHRYGHCPYRWHCHIHTDNHIHGIDLIAAKLNDISGVKTLLRGQVNGDYLKIVESNFDLTNLSYDESKGYKLHESTNILTKVAKTYSHLHNGWRYGYTHTHTVYEISQPVNLLVKSQDSIISEYQWTDRCYGYENCYHDGVTYKSHGKCYYRWRCTNHWHIYSGALPVTVDGSQEGDMYRITKLSATTESTQHFKEGTFRVYSREPYTTLASFDKDFETIFRFPDGKQTFVLAQPDGTSTIKAEEFDPDYGVWFKVKGLPPNTPYQLEKNGLVGARGLSPEDGSDLVLVAGAVNVGGQTTLGGTFKIYPDSLKYRGAFSTIVFDTVNGQTIRIDDANERVYTPFAYIRIPFTTPTSIEQVSIDGISLSYLAKNYSAGSAIDIPVLPGMKKIILTANGVDNIINLHDVAGKVGAKPVPPKTATNSEYSASGAISSIDSDAGSGAFAIATGNGQMYAMVTLSVSGDSAFSNDVSFYFVPDPPPPPPPRDPLSVFVDVYKNGRLVKSEKIYYDDKPVFEPVSELNGLKLRQAITYHYNQRTATSMVMTDVEPGDMVEFYARSHIHADGIPVQIPGGSGGKYVTDQVISAASATARIHSGSILTGMS